MIYFSQFVSTKSVQINCPSGRVKCGHTQNLKHVVNNLVVIKVSPELMLVQLILTLNFREKKKVFFDCSIFKLNLSDIFRRISPRYIKLVVAAN
jgi:hypothetical protein